MVTEADCPPLTPSSQFPTAVAVTVAEVPLGAGIVPEKVFGGIVCPENTPD
jgi:hypothetical protein